MDSTFTATPPSSSHPTTPHTVDAAHADELTDPMEREFLSWARQPDHKNKQRLSHYQRREYKSFLMDPNRKPQGQKEHNMRSRARQNFMILERNQLFRKPGDELEDDPDYQAANKPRRVIMLEETFAAIRRVHLTIGPHVGVAKTWGEVQRQFYGINRDEVAWVVRNCEVCQLNTSSNIQPPLKMIVSTDVNERWVCDLIDMRSRIYLGFCWLWHCKEAVSKRSFLMAQRDKRAETCAISMFYCLMAWGRPKIAQMDNGSEFKAALLILLRVLGIKIINGNPHKPTTQGLVEQGNGVVEDRLNKWMADNDTDNWPLGCLTIVDGIDVTLHRSMNMRPYQVMFGGRMPYMTEDNWLTVEERKTAKLPNEDEDDEDDEYSINLQARFERSNNGEAIDASDLPGNRILNNNLMRTFAPAAAHISFDGADSMLNSTRDMLDEPGPSSRPQRHADTSSRAREDADHQVAQQLQQELDRERVIPDSQPQNTFSGEPGYSGPAGGDAEFSTPNLAGEGSSSLRSSPSFHGFSEDDNNSTDSSNSSDDSSSSSQEGTPTLRNRPPGASKDWSINLTTLKARNRQASYRKKVEERFNRVSRAQTFEDGSIVTVKIPPKDRATGVENRRMFARVIDQKRNTYKLQTKYGVLDRRYHTRDLAPVAAPLAASQNIDDEPREISLHKAAAQESNASFARVSCRCKGSCDTKRCGCKKNGVRCSVYCHKGTRDCGRLISGPEFGSYSIVGRESKGKGKERAE